MAASDGFALALTAAMAVGKQGSRFAYISASLLPIVDGRHAHLFLEESTEGGGVGEVEDVCNFLDALVGGSY